jgi:hypothetical protein
MGVLVIRKGAKNTRGSKISRTRNSAGFRLAIHNLWAGCVFEGIRRESRPLDCVARVKTVHYTRCILWKTLSGGRRFAWDSAMANGMSLAMGGLLGPRE